MRLIRITFNRELDSSTLSGIALIGSGLGVVPSTLELAPDSETVTLTPSAALLHGTLYEVRIPLSVRDFSGNQLLAASSSHFTTVAANSLATPVISSVSESSPTRRATVTITGTATEGATVGALGVSDLAALGSGAFSLDVSLTENTTNVIDVTATDGTLTSAPATVTMVQDSTAPTVTIEPANTLTDVSLAQPWRVSFSEAIEPSSFSTAMTTSISGNWILAPSQKYGTFYPDTELTEETQYTITVSTAVTDLAGNPLASQTMSTFTTAKAPGGVDLLAAPILDPLGFDRTISPTITLKGSAEPNTTLYVLGAATSVNTEVGADGRFSVRVPLIQDAVNQLLVYVQEGETEPGLPASAVVTHYSRQTGIRILSPQAGLEYNNRSIMITGVLDNAVEIEKVMVSDINGEADAAEAALIGSFFARQIILDDYALVLGAPVAADRTLVIDQSSGLDFYFYQDANAPETHTVYDDVDVNFIDKSEEIAQLLIDLAEPDRNDAQIIADAMAIVQHSIDEGEHTVSVTTTLTNGSTQTQSIAFSLYIQPEDGDTRAPLVTFLYPETDEVISEDIIETFIVVEEGVQLSTVDIGGVVAHQSVGNFFLIYATPTQQGANTLTALAQDYSGNQGSAEVEVFFDSMPAATPTLSELGGVSLLSGMEEDFSQLKDSVFTDRVLSLSGSGEAGSTISVEGGLVPVQVIVPSNGIWTLNVPVVDNSSNILTVVALDAAGNSSDVKTFSFVHDDTDPYAISSIPVHGQEGVAPNSSISIEFSEPLDPETDFNSFVSVDSRLNPVGTAFDAQLSADGTTIEIIPAYTLSHADTITVTVAAGILDANGRQSQDAYQVSFDTALYITTLSGVVIDPLVKALQNIKVGIVGTDIYQYTSSFGTFILDDVPLGEQTLYVDARPNAATGVPPQGDDREFGYLEFPVTINENADNSLGRPIFMVDTDLSTAVDLEGLATQWLSITSDAADLDGFDIYYTAGTAKFSDGTDRGELTVTRIDPANIPDRLPDGSIPHFLVEIGARDLSIDPANPATIRFPNVYDLAAGEEVIVFYFSDGLADYQELTQFALGEDLLIEAEVLTESGFYGYIPASGDYDLTRAYLDGYVLNSAQTGIPNVSVTAFAGNTRVITDANGYYSIPLPEVRVLSIQTYATISNESAGAPELIYPSAVQSVKASGTTRMPAIIIDTFTLQGNIRYIDADGRSLPTNAEAVNEGVIVGVSPVDVRCVDLYAYRKLSDASYDSEPFMQTTSAADLIDDSFDASFSMRFFGADLDSSSENAPKPGDTIKIVAFDARTGYYGEVESVIPNATDDDFSANIDLRPPQITVDVNRVFYIDSTRHRANVPHQGIVFTDDEFVEFKTSWRTADAVPLARSELALSARLRVDSIDYQTDYPFSVMGGEQFRVLEVREALYPERLDVLQRETDVGTETLSISRNGTFNSDALIPMQISSESYGLSQSTSGTVTTAAQTKLQIYIIDFSVEEDGEQLEISGRAQAGQSLTIGDLNMTADANGYFSGSIDGSLSADGLAIDLGAGNQTRYGASYTPVISSLDPARGSQRDSVTISGEYFSPVALDNKVAFNGAPATVTAASESQLEVLVPDEASSGDVTVTVAGKVSNGVPFEFISEGINNGSFEHGSFRGFTLLGEGSVVQHLNSLVPTDRAFMALLHTTNNPISGQSRLTTNKLTVGSLSYLVFDLDLMGTVLSRDLNSYFYVSIINHSVITTNGDPVETLLTTPSPQIS